MKAKLLIVSYSFPPDNVPAAQRPYFMAKYLQESGTVDNIVLTSRNAMSSLGQSDWADLSNLNIVYTDKGTNEPGIQGQQKKKSGKGLKRSLLKSIGREILIPDKGILWFFKALRKAKEILRDHPDIKFIFSTSPSLVNHLIAYYVVKKTGIKWIADFRDFYYLNDIEEERYLFRKLIDRHIERKIVAAADHLVFIGNDMRSEYLKTYPGIRDSSVIFNGFDDNEFAGGEYRETPNKKFTIFYAGTFYNGIRSPFPLLKSLSLLVNDARVAADDIEVVIAGNISKDLLDRMKECVPPQMLTYLGQIPRKDVLKHMANADALWLIVGNRKSHYMGFPVKGFEYMAANRHVLLFAPEHSEASRIFSELNCGSAFSSDENDIVFRANAEKLWDVYKEFRNGSLNNGHHSGNDEAIKKYKRKYQAFQFSELLNKL
ncbi:Glycosyltransferase involved in cell wall bisynthesis [Chitinophaga sp. CF118]|uniref:hypothetical protein n=1 Tax=Chitinophaga sp. CF118 TaxID=1884367 RepID=UPI0008DF31A1|nr:hypothetical protein [Chitinophaga sp. CF118]SFD80716.1 Glycosyltransferase involved in cell wall bisynthesis [Chitinophaga sp. CF118]